MPTAELLDAAVIRPRDPQLPTPPTFAPALVNQRPIELIGTVEVPDPPKAGLTPARPARMPVAFTLATQAWQAVANDFFILQVIRPPAPRPGMPRGRLAPWRERANIDSRRADAYGSQFGYVDPVLAADAGPGFTAIPLAGIP